MQNDSAVNPSHVLSVDYSAVLRDQYKEVRRWFDTLATQPAFITGVEKVGLTVSPTVTWESVGSTVQSNAATTSQSFLNGKWKLRRNRPKPL